MRRRNFMIQILSIFFVSVFILGYLSRKYSNPYKLTFLFGKKGAGKSCWMVALMLKYIKAGYTVYTDMEDINIQGVRIISPGSFAIFRPEPHSVVFLDEVGISMDNRNFKSFPPGLRDFFKYIRKMKCIVYMNSQAFDVDKKVRDTTDSMALITSILGCISVYRPIKRSICLVDATGQSDSRIADNLRFTNLFTFRFLWMPKYFKYFNSLEMPAREVVKYTLPSADAIQPKFGFDRLRSDLLELRRSAESYFRDRFSC